MRTRSKRAVFKARRAAVLIAALLGAFVGLPAAAQPVSLEFPEQPLSQALRELARQIGIQIAIQSELTEGKIAPALNGRYEPDQALAALLRGTGLIAYLVNKNTYGIRQAVAEAAAAATDTSSADRNIHLTQATEPSPSEGEGTGEDSGQTVASEESDERARSQKKIELEEIVVTGSHIRGGTTASPILVFSQIDFDRAGAATAQQFLATLPQNFGGSRSDDTSKLLNLQGFDPSYGASANLRGLGTSSTLVLINGRRSAASGVAEYVDLSMIPLSAVERIEVLLDGASATYGSDAVGGVINFIMRDRYEGADTRLRYGVTTHGDAAQYQVAQAVGAMWSRGSSILTYEFDKQDQLSTTERSFSANSNSAFDGPRDLQPAQKTHALYASVHHSMTERISVSADATYAKRDAAFTDWDTYGLEFIYSDSENERYGGSAALVFDFSSSWELEFVANRSVAKTALVTDTSVTHFYGFGPASSPSKYDLSSFETKLSGGLLELPSGTARIALGGGYRDESFVFSQGTETVVFTPRTENSFNSKFLFSELMLPLQRSSAQANAPRLALTLAGRYEEYDSFGSTIDPKIGVKWAPTSSVSVRGTYGTSFKAPSVYQLSEFNVINYVSDVPNAQSAGTTTRSILRTGNNSELHEETATTWTFGLDLSPPRWPALKSHLTYFKTKYNNRIGNQPVGTAALFSDPRYESLVTRRGDISDAEFNALVVQLLSGDHRISGCETPLDPSTLACTEAVANINAIIDGRLGNAAAVEVSGLDWTSSQAIESRIGRLGVELNVSYLLKFAQSLAPQVTADDQLDTANNPTKLRTRGNLTWNTGPWTAVFSVNYTNSYSNRGATDINTGLPLPPATIASWTTCDLNLQYAGSQQRDAGLLNGIAISLNISNLFDKDPPYFDDNLYGLGYDPANADPMGRRLSLLLRKSW